MRSYKVEATDEATAVVEADDMARTVYVHAVGDTVYVGGENVSSTNGLPVLEDTTSAFFVPTKETLFVVCADAETADIFVLTPDPDDVTAGLYPDPEEEPEEPGEPEPE